MHEYPSQPQSEVPSAGGGGGGPAGRNRAASSQRHSQLKDGESHALLEVHTRNAQPCRVRAALCFRCLGQGADLCKQAGPEMGGMLLDG